MGEGGAASDSPRHARNICPSWAYVHEDYCYAVMDKCDPSLTVNQAGWHLVPDRQAGYLALDAGWQLAPDTAVVRREVVAKRPWGTHFAVLAGGKACLTCHGIDTPADWLVAMANMLEKEPFQLSLLDIDDEGCYRVGGDLVGRVLMRASLSLFVPRKPAKYRTTYFDLRTTPASRGSPAPFAFPCRACVCVCACSCACSSACVLRRHTYQPTYLFFQRF